jgi:hypothetical protein
MSTLETDDEIAAGSCINKESAKRFKDDCIAKLHYKQAMCELAIARGHIAGGVNRCLADQDFVGSTVRNGGVGGNLRR